MLGEVPALRPAARTGEKGAAPGEPAGGPQDACFRSGDRFSPFWHFMPWSGAGREKRRCGPLILQRRFLKFVGF